MLGKNKIIAFVPTKNSARARTFYETTLGLRLLSDDPFAIAFDANGTMLRVVKVEEFVPAPFTILGWEVSNIEDAVRQMTSRGISFEVYQKLEQDDLGIWTSPTGSRVAWFKDPDRNVLSISQH